MQYGHLLETWRDHQWRGRHRPLLARALMLVVDRKPLVRLIGWSAARPYARAGTLSGTTVDRRANGAAPGHGRRSR